MNIYNKVLWNAPSFLKETAPGEYISTLPAQIEYIISVGVMEIAMPYNLIIPKLLDNVDSLLRDRIVVIDESYNVMQKTKALFSPICEEFKIKYEFPGVLMFRMLQEYSDEFNRTLASFINSVYLFMLGVEYNLQIFGDIIELKRDASVIRSFCKGSHARAILSILEGFFSAYEVQSIETFEIRSNAPRRSIEFFDKLLRDATYRSISSEFHSIGYPSRYVESISIIRKLCSRIVEKQAFKGLFNFASKVISTATQIPMPSADIADALKVKEYFPPILHRDLLFEAQDYASDDYR